MGIYVERYEEARTTTDLNVLSHYANKNNFVEAIADNPAATSEILLKARFPNRAGAAYCAS